MTYDVVFEDGKTWKGETVLPFIFLWNKLTN